MPSQMSHASRQLAMYVKKANLEQLFTQVFSWWHRQQVALQGQVGSPSRTKSRLAYCQL